MASSANDEKSRNGGGDIGLSGMIAVTVSRTITTILVVVMVGLVALLHMTVPKEEGIGCPSLCNYMRGHTAF